MKLSGKVTDAIVSAYQQTRTSRPEHNQRIVELTAHLVQRQRWATWCFRAEWDTFAMIDPARGSLVRGEMLGKEFAGMRGCDYFSAYRKYRGDGDRAGLFCLAQRCRDGKGRSTLPDPGTAALGLRVLDGMREWC